MNYVSQEYFLQFWFTLFSCPQLPTSSLIHSQISNNTAAFFCSFVWGKQFFQFSAALRSFSLELPLQNSDRHQRSTVWIITLMRSRVLWVACSTTNKAPLGQWHANTTGAAESPKPPNSRRNEIAECLMDSTASPSYLSATNGDLPKDTDISQLSPERCW